MTSNEVAEATSSNKGVASGVQQQAFNYQHPVLQNLTTYNPQAHYPNSVLQYSGEKLNQQSCEASDDIQIQSPQSSGTISARPQVGQASSTDTASASVNVIGMKDSYAAEQRPGLTYEELAIMALEILPSNNGTLADILCVIQYYFPFFRNRPSKTWKGSLRHSVSRSPYICRITSDSEKNIEPKTPLEGSIPTVPQGQNSNSAQPAPQVSHRKGPRTPIVWELYEPAEDDVRGRKKPRRATLPPLPSDFFSQYCQQQQNSRKKIVEQIKPSQQMPNTFDQLKKPLKLDHNAKVTLAPQYSHQQLLYGTHVTPEMYPFVTTLLDLSRNRVSTSTHTSMEHDGHAAKKPRLSPQKVLPSAPSFVHHQVWPPKPVTPEEVKRSLTSPTVSSSGHDYAKVPPPYTPSSNAASFINQEVPKSVPDSTKCMPTTSYSSYCALDFYNGQSMVQSKPMQQPSYPAWPANVLQSSQSFIKTPNQQLQHDLPAAPAPIAHTASFTSYQTESSRPISWKVQSGYLVQTPRGPSPPPIVNPQVAGSSVSLLASPGVHLTDNEAHSQLFQPWQITQYPWMQSYQIPPRAQRYPLFNTDPSQAHDIHHSPPRQQMTSVQNIRARTYPYPGTDVDRSFGSQESYDKSFGSQGSQDRFGSTSSTPSLVDSGIVRDSGMDSLSPGGSEDTLSSRPVSEGVIVDDLV